MNQLTRFDTAALSQLNRAMIGFDRLFEDAGAKYSQTTYPPYNIIKHSENSFEIELAIAGFGREDISIEVDKNQLTIKGQTTEHTASVQYLHHGLASRDFQRSFTLMDHIEVGDASLTNGVLRVKLTRIIPESLKPRVIEIK